MRVHAMNCLLCVITATWHLLIIIQSSAPSSIQPSEVLCRNISAPNWKSNVWILNELYRNIAQHEIWVLDISIYGLMLKVLVKKCPRISSWPLVVGQKLLYNDSSWSETLCGHYSHSNQVLPSVPSSSLLDLTCLGCTLTMPGCTSISIHFHPVVCRCLLWSVSDHHRKFSNTQTYKWIGLGWTSEC